MNERIQQSWRSRPWFWVAVASLPGLLGWTWLPWVGWSVIVGFGLFGALWFGWRGWVGFGVGPALVLAGLVVRESARSEVGENMLAARFALLQARVLRDAKGGQGSWAALAKVQGGHWDGALVWWQGGGSPPVAGARVSGSGDFQPLPVTRNEGEFDRAAWLRTHGVAAVFDCRSRVRVTTPWLAEWGAKLKREFRDRIGLGLDPASVEAMVLRAVVIGETPQDADSVVAAFRESGTLHAFSVSGLHVAMVGALGWWLLSKLGLRRSRAVFLLIPLVFGYAWITGNSDPAVRSAWMAAVFLAAFPLRRRVDLLNTLGLVLWFGLCWDARMLFLPGVQLSYGVVAAIALGTGVARKWLSWIDEAECYLPESEFNRWQRRWLACRVWLAQSLSVGISAGLGSAPLTALHFGMVTPISILAGLVLIPLVFVMLILSFAVVMLSPCGTPAIGLNRVNSGVAALSVHAARFFASVPWGHMSTRSESESKLRVFDLDRGAGALCFSGDGAAVLLDAGNQHGFRYQVAPALRSVGLEPDSAVFSHPDGSHLGGGLPIWETFPIRQVMLPVSKSLSPAFRGWQRAALTSGIAIVQPRLGSRLPLPGGAWLEILHVPDPLALQALADERVMVFRIRWHGWRILYTSDAGQNTEDAMLETQSDLRSDVLVIGRHRSGLTLGETFLQAVSPRIIIAGNDPFPLGERIPGADIAFWISQGIRVFDQQKTGGVTLTLGPNRSLCARGHVDGSRIMLHAVSGTDPSPVESGD